MAHHSSSSGWEWWASHIKATMWWAGSENLGLCPPQALCCIHSLQQNRWPDGPGPIKLTGQPLVCSCHWCCFQSANRLVQPWLTNSFSFLMVSQCCIKAACEATETQAVISGVVNTSEGVCGDGFIHVSKNGVQTLKCVSQHTCD